MDRPKPITRPGAKPAVPKIADAEAMAVDEIKKMRDRIKRTKLEANDSENYICVSFKNREELTAWLELKGLRTDTKFFTAHEIVGTEPFSPVSRGKAGRFARFAK